MKSEQFQGIQQSGNIRQRPEQKIEQNIISMDEINSALSKLEYMIYEKNKKMSLSQQNDNQQQQEQQGVNTTANAYIEEPKVIDQLKQMANDVFFLAHGSSKLQNEIARNVRKNNEQQHDPVTRLAYYEKRRQQKIDELVLQQMASTVYDNQPRSFLSTQSKRILQNSKYREMSPLYKRIELEVHARQMRQIKLKDEVIAMKDQRLVEEQNQIDATRVLPKPDPELRVSPHQADEFYKKNVVEFKEAKLRKQRAMQELHLRENDIHCPKTPKILQKSTKIFASNPNATLPVECRLLNGKLHSDQKIKYQQVHSLDKFFKPEINSKSQQICRDIHKINQQNVLQNQLDYQQIIENNTNFQKQKWDNQVYQNNYDNINDQNLNCNPTQIISYSNLFKNLNFEQNN